MTEYSFEDIIASVSGTPITGYAEGDDVIQARRREDAFSDIIGADGEMLVIHSPNKSGEFIFRLKQTSPSNKYLNDIFDRQEAGSIAFAPVSVGFKNIRTGEKIDGVLGYIPKPTEITRGAGHNAQEWRIVVENFQNIFSELQAISNVVANLGNLI